MTLRIVRLGSDRVAGEGLRIGTVRRPPRGIAKGEYAAQNWFDVWFPNLAPSPAAVAAARLAKSERDWSAFVNRYRAEMEVPDNRRTIDLLAALSHHADFSIGCYCADESRCHRSVLRELLVARGAKVG
jgi:uncharacterized protein YeaO (DUF488 family)